jgi:fimbrial isopeptide formation D2 family protein/LPXTG-motif cell wall-anchored protein
MYKIVDVSISDSNSLDYEFTDLFKAFLASDTYKASYGSLTTDTWAGYSSESTEVKDILSDFTIYLKGLSTAPAADYTATTSQADDDGNVTGTFTGVGLGQYIILGGGKSTDTRIYRSVTANVVPSVVDSKYMINTEYDLVMKSSLPTISKTVTGVRTEDDIQSASVGDTMTYQLNALVPEFPNKATNKTFYVRDTLSKGLSLTSEPVVKDASGTVLTKGTDYTYTQSGQTFYIDFNMDSNAVKTTARVYVTYSAKLNDNAVISGDGNKNTSAVVYANDPFSGSTYDPSSGNDRPEGKDGYGKSTSEQTVYTFAIRIVKTDESTSKALANAEFAVYTSADCTDSTKVGTITTDSNGIGSLVGVKEGAYWIKETKAPTGYQKLTEAKRITVAKSAASVSNATVASTKITTTTTYTSNVDEAMYKTQATDASGNLLYIDASATNGVTTAKNNTPAYVKSFTRTVSDSGTVAAQVVSVAITNKAGGELPSTGGIGVVPFIAVGAVLMVGAAIVLITKKRTKNAEK